MGNIKIKCPRLQKEFAPEEISALVLRRLAEEASRYLGEEVTWPSSPSPPILMTPNVKPPGMRAELPG
jgi:hypothetical protein